MKIIVLGGGCFWCTETIFKMIRGVESVLPGYAGGQTENPTYEEVCSGTTGHAEVVQIIYDEAAVKLSDLFTIFFATHDPSSLNRQGNDIGTEYRSIIFYTSPEQKIAAEKFIAELNSSTIKGSPIVTEVKPLDQFYPAEDDRRDYYLKNKNLGYCQVVINPKIEKVKAEFRELLNKPTGAR